MALPEGFASPGVTIFLMSVFLDGRTDDDDPIRSLSMISRKPMVLSRWVMIRRMTGVSEVFDPRLDAFEQRPDGFVVHPRDFF